MSQLAQEVEKQLSKEREEQPYGWVEKFACGCMSIAVYEDMTVYSQFCNEHRKNRKEIEW